MNGYMTDYSVNAVVVTYNRLELLKLSLERLQKQSYKLNSIIVVNNASTDGTAAYLKSIRDNTKLVMLNLKKNIGGAGGFFCGIKKAYEIGCDYIWIMDDDTLAEPDALEKLVNASEVLKGKKVGFLASNVLYKDGSPCLMNISKTVPMWNEFIQKGIIEISHTSFVAMLIPSEVVEKVGLPIKEYFIWGDDAEYSTRILRAGYSGYQVGDSTVYHYMNENLGVDIFNTPKERINRFYYFYRNITTTDRMKGPGQLVLRVLYHCFIILKILLGKTDHKLIKCWTVFSGTVCGMFRKNRIVYVNKRS